MNRKLFTIFLIHLSHATILKMSLNQEKIEASNKASNNLHQLDTLLHNFDQQLNDKKLELVKQRKLVSLIKNEEKNIGRKLSFGGGGVKPAIINIPVPRIKETELEVVHVFP